MWLNAILDFTSSVVSSISWPIAVVISVYFLRRKFFEWLGNARRIKFGEAEINLDREVDDVVVSAMDRGITVFGRDSGPNPNGSFNPLAFLSVWQGIEKAFGNYFQAITNGVSGPKIVSNPRMLFQKAFKENLIDENLYKTLIELYELRNLVSHDMKAFEDKNPNTRELMNLTKSVSERVSQALGSGPIEF